MTQIADLTDRLTRLATRREDEGIYTDAMIASAAAERIAALEAQLAKALSRTGAVNVKALEWKTLREGESYAAVGASITYRLVKAALSATAWSWYRLGTFQHECESFEAARDAAQADYERRIKSAITAEPLPAEDSE